MPNTRQSRFLHAVDDLKLRFPVADISKKTGFKESTVSTYLTKRDVSENFLRKFCEDYGYDFNSIWNGPAPQMKKNEESKKDVTHNELAEDSPAYAKQGESAVYKIAESNYILAKVQQDAIATAKDAVAAANKIADGNLVLIEANNRMAGLLIEMQKKTLTESALEESLTGATATLEVLRGFVLADGVGKHWKTVDEGAARLNKQIAEAVQNNKAKGTHDGAHK